MSLGNSNYDLSVVYWVSPETLSGSQFYRQWSKDSTAWTNGDAMNFTTNQGTFSLTTTTPQSIQKTSSAITLEADLWYFVANTYNGTSGEMRLYIYDANSASIIFNDISTYDPASFDSPLLLGRPFYVGSWQLDTTTVARNFDGNIDEFSVWNRVLSVADINDIRDGAYIVPATSGVSNWWWRRRHNN